MSDATSEAVGRWMERYRLQFIAGLALCGVLITMLSFAPWVRFESIEGEDITPDAPKAKVTMAGSHLSRWRDEENLLRNDVKNEDGWCSCHVALGDGYLTAMLGVAMVGAAATAFFRRADRPMVMAGVVAALGTLVVSAYNGFGDWNAYVWTNLQNLEVTTGTVLPWLYFLIAVSVVASLFAGLLWGAGAEEVHEEMLEEEEWDTGPSDLRYNVEKSNAWEHKLGMRRTELWA